MLPPVRFPLTPTDLWLNLRSDGADAASTLEQAFARHFGFPYALIFPYARIALHALITAHGWQNKKILCPAYTCAVVPLAIRLSGNLVEFVDCAAHHFLPGPSQWAAYVTSETKMMIVTPLYGYPVDKNSEVAARATAPDIFVLYDEAQSLGAADKIGFQTRDADGALFSLGPGKMLPALSGGLLLLRSEDVYREVRTLRNARCHEPNLRQLARRVARGLAMWAAFCGPVFSSLLYAGRLAPQVSLERISAREVMETNFPPDAQVLPSSYQAQIALYQLERLGALTAARQRIARFYDQRLREEGFTTFTYSVTPTWTRYPLAVSDRAKVMSAFAKENLQLGWFLRYTCEDVLNVKSKSPLCRNAQAWAQSMINLPNWPGIAMADAERCVSLLLRLRDHDGQASAWPMAVT